MKLSLALTPAPTVFAPLLFAGDLSHGIHRADELGYDGVELNLRDPQVEDLDSILAETSSRNLEIVALGTGQAYLEDGLSVASDDPDIRSACITRLKNQVDFAAHAGAQVVIGGIRGKFNADSSIKEKQYSGAVDVVQQVADYASEHNVTVTLEPINRYESNFLNNLDETLQFLEDVERFAVKVLLDTFHMNIEEASLTEPFIRAIDRLSHVHLVDSNRYAPGMGHIDFESIIEILRDQGYSGYLSGEFLPVPDDDIAAEKNIEYLRKLLEA
jgi:sugar phosphate isomerase/epimerase